MATAPADRQLGPGRLAESGHAAATAAPRPVKESWPLSGTPPRPASWALLGELVDRPRQAAPEEIADFVMFVASDQARLATGTELVADGGFGLGPVA